MIPKLCRHERQNNRFGPLTAIISLQFCFLLSPPLVYALQTHGGYEGLFAHQGAHLFFTVSMAITAIRIRYSILYRQKSWRYMILSAWLLVVWNLWAFTGHIITLFIPSANIITVEIDQAPMLNIESWKEVAYYLLKMDHLLCVPALLFLYLGLRAMAAVSQLKEPSPERTQKA